MVKVTIFLTDVFGVLTLIGMAVIVALWVSKALRERVARWSLPLVAAGTAGSAIGSLYYSEIAEMAPCELCWIQRIFVYSLAVVSVTALVRRKDDVYDYLVPLSVIGLGFSIYHIFVQRLPSGAIGMCDPNNPCDSIWVERFGFITIPVMAAVMFVFVLTMVWVHYSTRAETAPNESNA